MSSDSTSRFSNRVDDYVRHRPTYPRAVIEYMHAALGLDDHATIADIGSGTGIFTKLLLDVGHAVYAIEPNAPMRDAAEKLLEGTHGFISVAGTAEDTTLDSSSVDAITVAQAFHWFDVQRSRAEFVRILRSGGPVVLLWNDRREDQSPFSIEYQSLIDTYNTDLATIDHRRITRSDDVIREFFGDASFETATFDNSQTLDFEGLRGRLVSSSYIPAPGDSGYDAMITELQELFERHAVDGVVEIGYDTKLFAGRLEDRR